MSESLIRCSWARHTEIERDYHDIEWGRPVTTNNGLFERLSLEAFQSGLSWLTILRKREAFRAAFANFDAQKVAQYDGDAIHTLLANPDIVRNRAKIEATIANAQALLELRPGESLHGILTEFAPAVHRIPATRDHIPSSTPESAALAKHLKARGFRFVGPTTAYAMMQAVGIVNDHEASCWVNTQAQLRHAKAGENS